MPNLSLERPTLAPLQGSYHESDDEDVYRGSPSPPSIHSLSRIDTSTSSSSSISFPGRAAIGAFAQVVEQAVARWAKGIAGGHSSASSTTSSSSSSSSSTSSSASSRFTLARSFSIRRRKRRNSTTRSEAEITARIKALHESRQIHRTFALYLPPSLADKRREGVTWTDRRMPAQHVHETKDLSDVLTRLDAALKRSSKARRAGVKRAKTPDPSTSVTSPGLRHDYMMPDAPPSRPISLSDLTDALGKGKGKQTATPVSIQSPQAWWLDVASPTWKDLQAIGKLLHLHPLTLEDILQQDPREKLESFQRLGYYFISFRAVESSKARQTLRGTDQNKDVLQGKGWHAERVLETQDIGEANIYLVVFREGICSFHYTDMKEHTERVRKRLSTQQDTEVFSSDWIAHGILDSIVDSFFPFLDEIENEVSRIEDVVFSDGSFWGNSTQDASKSDETLAEKQEDKSIINEKLPSPATEYNEKSGLDDLKECRSLLDAPRSMLSCFPKLSIPSVLRPFYRLIHKQSKKANSSSSKTENSTYSMLLRMARTRRLVTSLARLLTAKADIISHVQKRLLTSSDGLDKRSGRTSSKTVNSDEQEVAIYMGDIQDHIYTLHHSLFHYERMLSESHPTYLTRLSVVQAKTKSGGDKAILFLSIISIGVLCGQTTIGCFSMNVKIPSNDPGVYNMFGIVISIVVVVLSCYLTILRHWWRRSKRKRSNAL